MLGPLKFLKKIQRWEENKPLEINARYIENLCQRLNQYYPWADIRISSRTINDLIGIEICLHPLRRIKVIDPIHDLSADINVIPDTVFIGRMTVGNSMMSRYRITNFFKEPFFKKPPLMLSDIPATAGIIGESDSYIQNFCGPNMMFPAHNTWMDLYLFTLGLHNLGWRLALNQHFDWVMSPPLPGEIASITFINRSGSKEYSITKKLPSGDEIKTVRWSRGQLRDFIVSEMNLKCGELQDSI